MGAAGADGAAAGCGSEVSTPSVVLIVQTRMRSLERRRVLIGGVTTACHLHRWL